MIVFILFYFVSGLFLAKIVWNMGVPFVLACRAYEPDSDRTPGISISPYVEVILLVLAFLVSLFFESEVWWLRPKWVGLGGLGLILFSYFFMIVIGVVIGGVKAARSE